MIRKLAAFIVSCLISIAPVFVSPASGQPDNLAAVQRQLAIFAGILEESLQLNESTGLFGMSLGGVESMYLYDQGAVFEVRSPLANRRNRMGLASLSSAMQALQLRQNPFQAMSLSADSTAAVQPQGLAESSSVENSYRQLLDRIAAIDYSAIAQGAMQQASQSARALRALDTLDDEDFAALNQEIAGMRANLDRYLAGLRDLEQEIRERVTGDEPNAESGESFSMRLEALLQSMEPIKDQALAKADELRAQAEKAEQDYAAAWQRDLEAFQQNLYVTLCEYGDALDAMAEGDSVSVILKGLGEEQGENRRTDLIHIVSNGDIMACAAGETDVLSLQESATSYTY